ncbi:MAG: hypothetical protein ACR2NZ_15455, partial [Rubripirellula sp.]
QALMIVRKRNFKDARFNEMIRDAMRISENDPAILNRTLAVDLMSYATLDEKEQVTLMLDQLSVEDGRFMEWSDEEGEGSLRKFMGRRPVTNAIVRRLPRFEEEFEAQLRARLEAEPLAIYCATASVAGSGKEELLPLLLKAASESEVPAVQHAAIASADTILSDLQREQDEVERLEQRARDSESKYLRYAERIIDRYDKNSDGALVEEEWKAMLMTPVDADADNDGRITTEEYGAFMENRANR